MKKKVWPYVLPLPLTEQYSLLSSVFASKVSVKILEFAGSEKRIYQKDLIERLSEYSNKTVIGKLKKLVASGVLNEGMEKKVKHAKIAWVKWYEPTFIGKWISLLLQPPGKVPHKEAERILVELFGLYAKSAINLCVQYNIDPDVLRDAFEEAFKTSVRGE